MEPRKPEAIYPLSPAQHGMLLYQVLAEGSDAYFEQCVLDIGGELDAPAFIAAWQNAADRHPALRTFFLWERRERPLQVVLPRLELPFSVEDWRELSGARQEELCGERLEADKKLGFALGRPPLLRFQLWRLADDRWRLLWSFSHLLLDGWSVGNLLGEVLQSYDRLLDGEALATKKAAPFQRYIEWLEKQDKKAAEAFFRQQLGGIELPISLPADRAPGAPMGSRQARFATTRQLERPLPGGIAELARGAGVTANLVVHAAWALLLQELCGVDQVVFGSVIADRPPKLEGIEEMAGLFINALPFAARRQEGDSFLSLLQRLQSSFVALTRQAFCQVEEIARWLGLPHDAPLFESLLVFQNFPPAGASRKLAVSLRENLEVTNHPLALYFHPAENRPITLQLVYDSGRFRDSDIERLVGDYQRILGAMIAAPAMPLADFELTAPDERRRVLELGSGAPAAGAAPPAFRAFEAQARARAEAPAIEQIGRAGALTYGELEAQANRLAHHLLARGLAPGELVLVALARSPALIIALLAIGKAGAAYLPAEASTPGPRLRLLAADAGVRLALVQEKTASGLGELVDCVLLDALVDDPRAWPFAAAPTTPPAIAGAADGLAYLIYTSGSTGQPKGVLVEHAQLGFYTADAIAAYGIGAADRLLQFASLGFDTSAEEIWPALAAGATLVLRSDEMIASPRHFLSELEKARISVLNLPTAYWHELCAELDDAAPPLPNTLRAVILGGEAASPARLERWRRHLGERRLPLWNTYGPTETTIVATRALIDDWTAAQWDGEVPIGRPIAGGQVYVVDGRGRLRSPGLPGELWIAGAGVARGYLHPPPGEEAFIADPFRGHGRLYRTGDRVAMREDGVLLFRGRTDQQVKIRGYRVEPGEIEACLLRHPEVKDALVMARPIAGEKRLTAYFVPSDPAAPPAAATLREFLAAALPDYMVPAAFLALPALPKTPSGKVDRQALPAPSGQDLAQPAAELAPRTPTEIRLAALFGELLGVGQVGRDDDFFALGGHSLLLGRLTSRLRKELGVELSLLTVFENPKVEALAAAVDRLLESASADEKNTAEPAPRPSGLPDGVPRRLSFAQERLYFLYRFDPASPAYNVPVAWRLFGRLDREALRRALAWLAARHPALRTVFPETAGVAHQRVEPPAADLVLPFEALPEARLAERLRELAETPFELETRPPWRGALFEVAGDDQVLFLAFHHICFDGLSYLLIEKELAAAYAAFTRGEEPDLPPPAYSYADFADHQAQRLAPELLARQVEYWRGQLALEPLELPTDRPRPKVASGRGAFLEIHLEAARAAGIEELCRRFGVTPFVGLLAPFLALLARLSGQDRVAVGSPFAGRELPGSDGIVGFFVNTVVLGARLGRDTSFRQLAEVLRERLKEAFAHQDVPFERLVTELQPQHDSSRNPLFQVGFQVLEADPEPPSWPGLAVGRQRAELRAAKFDLELMVKRSPRGGFDLEALFAADLFEPATIERWLELYALLLVEAAAAPDRPLSQIELLRPQDRALYAALNATTTDYPRSSNLIDAFAARALAGPELIAAEYAGATLTYGELDRRSRRLARRLLEEGAGPGAMVGVCLPRGLELVVAILAIVKTGSAYVPLDADYPAERLAAMVADTRMPLLLAGAAQRAALPALETRVLAAEELAEEAAAHGDASLPALLAFADSAAYVIFTSGSTGRPKGVVIPHRGVLRLVLGTTLFEIAPGDTVAQISTASFDAYTIEMWGALLHGGRLLVIDRETQLDPPAFAAAIDREIALLPLNASFFAQLVLAQPNAFRRARYLFFGGEASELGIVRRAIAAKPRHLKNTYGPTECTMLATAFEVPDSEEELDAYKVLPIGRPISNTEALVLDRHGLPSPIGVEGELCLGGDGLAWGYLGRPALTAAAFVPHPASAEPGARLYRTGDLTRLLPAGQLEYLGRIDSQVKVRGFRIELGEIEACLGRHPAVREKIALTRGRGADQMLLAFVVAARDERGEPQASAAELQRFCAAHLPAYAVPLVQLLAALPMTPTGKIDRQALLRADAILPEAGAAPAPPATPMEQLVAEIFAEVLGLASAALGRDSDFFACGGHSLLAIRLIGRLRERSGADLPVRTLFSAPTVALLAAAAEAALLPAPAAGPGSTAAGERPARALAADSPPVLSFAQQRLFFLHRFDPTSPVYNLPAAFELRGPLDRAALAAALAAVEERQEILRTRYRLADGAGAPELLPAGAGELPCENLPETELEARLRQLTAEPFDLLRDKPWRKHLLALGEERHVLFLNVHHIAFDGASLQLLGHELAAFYGGRGQQLPALPWTYADFAAWQKAWLEGAELERQLAFWRGRLEDEPLELPLDRPRPKVASFRGATFDRRLDAAVVRPLEELGRSFGATPFLTFLAPFLMLLARLSGQNRIPVGVPFSGRHRGEVGNLCGFFINTLVISADFKGDPSLATLLPRLRADFARVYENQDVPFEKLVEELKVERDPSRNPLFQVAFQLFEKGDDTLDFGPALEVAPLPVDLEVAKLDLDVGLIRDGDGIHLGASYASDLFDRSTIERWLDLYEMLLRQVAAAPDCPSSRLAVLRPQDRALYAAINATAADYSRDGNLNQAFAAAAAAFPDEIAVEYHGATSSYRQLDRRSNRLARRLLQEGAEPGAMIGVSLPRGLELVVAILAIVKTGGAYVPLDADYPAERLAAMAEDTHMSLVLAGARQRKRLEALGQGLAGHRLLAADQLETEAAALSDEPLPANLATADSAAYVIFTSGSTGRPKGVVIPHRGILRLVLGTRLFELSPGELVVQVSTSSFDAYTFEFWSALLHGGRLLVIDRDTQLDLRAFAAAIDREIALMLLSSSFFAQLTLERPAALRRVRHLYFGGEASELGVLRRVLAQKPAHLLNVYGPTECTTLATAFEVPGEPADFDALRALPIGRPIANTEALVLDRFGELAPLGAAGELCLSGDGLAWGYLGRPALTAAAFVPHPAPRRPGERLYRTGDLTRLSPGGQIEFLGRIDAQVKVRGFRIELGEIEAVLGSHPAVREKIALTRGRGAEQMLLAFAVAARDAAGEPQISATALQLYCAEHLPSYAVPLVHLVPAMPLTPTGKIDRRALLQMDFAFGPAESAAEPPREGLEREIAETWSAVLKVPLPPRQADFFALGGHSLAAMRILSALHHRLGAELPLPLLFTHPVLADFAAAAAAELATRAAAAPGEAAATTDSPPASAAGPWPLSFGQERMWLLDQMKPGTAAFNMPSPLRLRGPLDPALLEAALAELERRHEALRTVFPSERGAPRQEILPPSFRLERVDLTALPPAERARRAEALRDLDAARPFDLAVGPLFRASLLALSEDEHLLLLNFHHAIFDGWSSGVFFRELQQLYGDLAAGRPVSLPPPPVAYREFARWQRDQLSGERLEKELAYWRAELADASPLLALPLDRARLPDSARPGAFLHATIDGETTGALRRLAIARQAPLFPLLLAAFQVLLQRISGQNDILVGIPVVDRPRVDLENTLGLFLNTLVIRAQVDGELPFAELFRATAGKVLAAREHQLIPFEKLVLELQPERSTSQTPFFQVLFNFANLPDQNLELPGLTVEPLTFADPPAKVDLNLYLFEAGEALDLQLVYDRDLFDRARMEELLRQYRLLLEQVAADPSRPAGLYSLRSARAALRLPDPAAPLPRLYRASIVDIFRARAAAQPGHPALESLEGSLSYGELASRSAALAAHLAAAGIGRGEVVAIWAHRSAALVEALYGVLGAGAAFVILDSSYPAGRLLDYCELARPRLLLALAGAGELPEELATALAATHCGRLDLPAAGLPSLPADWPAPTLAEGDLAYVAFTSGSTGKPKAILGLHGSLAAFLPTVATTFDLRADDRHGMVSALPHDPLQRDVFIALGLGMTLVLPDPAELASPGYLAGWARAQRISVMNLVPAMLQLLCRPPADEPDLRLPALRRVLVVGDVLHRAEVAALYAIAPEVRVINLYGSTETQRALSYLILPREAEALELDRDGELGTRGLHKASLPLGLGYDGVQLIVRNAQGLPAGVSEVGEIFLRSLYLARGYLDAEQTREAFLANPFTDSPDDRLYKTGDLGRYLPDGGVEFLGRRDFQVKVRGFRIELQEIEGALEALPAIAAAVAIVREDQPGEKRVVAYYVERAAAAPMSPRELRRALARTLPDYLLPSALVALPALPLSPNGKVDRRALPPPPQPEGEAGFRPCANFYEEEIASLWAALLGHQAIGADANFFELGGHSLLATQMLARLRDAFGVGLPLGGLFEAPTVEGLAERLRQAQHQGAGGAALPRLAATPRPPRLPLSFAQQRLWFLEQLDPGQNAYLLAGAMRLRGRLEVPALEAAFGALIERHEALRTRIVTVDGEGWQLVGAPSPLAIEPLDLRRLPAAERDNEARRIAEEELRTPLALDAESLLRVRLLRLDEESWWMTLVLHHIVADGWSLGILGRELAELYAGILEGRPAALPALPLQPADVALWERSWLHGEALERQLDFWRRALEGAPPALELPTDFPRPAQQSFGGARLPLRVPGELAGRLRALGREEGATLFMVLLTAFEILLARHAGAKSVVVGTPIAHREHTELEGLIGFFANTLPLRLDFDEQASFASHLARLRRTSLEAFAHQDLPFEKLVAELATQRDLARSPIFQVMFSLQTLAAQNSRLGQAEVEAVALDLGRSQFDLTWTVHERAGEPAAELTGFLEWNVELFTPATVERLGERLLHLLQQVAADKNRPAGLYHLEAEADRLLLETFGQRPAAAFRSLPAAIAAQAAARPAAVAVGLEGQAVYTYAALLQRAGQLARHLRRLGAGPEKIVGLAVGRTPELVPALLAIWQAGAAYLPLDPIYPAQRLAYMFEDSGAELLIVDSRDEAAPAELIAKAKTVIDLASFTPAAATEPGGWPAAECSPSSLAYVLYTSGSTGHPKGVLIEHGSLANFIASMAAEPGLSPDDRLLSPTTLSFDIAGLEIWLPLAVGARVDLARRETVQDADLLAAALRQSEATVMQATPATWRLLLAGDWPGRPGLKALCGGEALPGELAQRLLGKVNSLFNVYGPTETTVWSSLRPVRPGEAAAVVPLGRSIAATAIRLVDAGGQAVPPGVAGELAIGGRGLARGYHRRPSLTADKFRPDPGAAEPGGRLYHTGDLARLRLDGELEYLGRIDFQVKVRGFRIELGEIEAALESHPAVAQAVVVTRGDGPSGARLVGYYRLHAEAAAAPAELQEFLRRGLPDYMVPAVLVLLENFPLTPNLKVDRRALPAPEAPAKAAPSRLPQSPQEKALAAIWQDLLKVPQVGADDNFFALGGDSIVAIQVVARARQAGLALTPRDLFLTPTLAALAAVCRQPAAPQAVASRQEIGGIEVVGELSAADLAQLDDLFGDS